MELIRRIIATFLQYIKLTVAWDANQQVHPQLIIVIGVISQLIPLSYSIVPTYFIMEHNQYFEALAYLARPYLILSQSSIYGIQIMLFVVINYTLISMYFIKGIPQSQYEIIIMDCFINFLQVYDIWLFNSIVELLLLQIGVLSIITLVEFIVLFIYKIVVLKTTFYYKANTFQVFQLTFLYGMIIILNACQILIFVFGSDNTVNTLLQTLIGLLISLFTIFNVIRDCFYFNYNYLLICLIMSSNGLIYQLIRIFQNQTQFDIKFVELAYILIFPLVSKLVIRIVQSYVLLGMIHCKSKNRLAFTIMYLQRTFQYSQRRILMEALMIQTQSQIKVPSARFTLLNPNDQQQFLLNLSIQHLKLSTDNDLIPHISLLFYLQEYYNAFKLINRTLKRKLSSLEIMKLTLLYDQCKRSLLVRMSLQVSTIESKEIEDGVKKLIRSEDNNKEISVEMLRLCKKKIEFYQHHDTYNDELFRMSYSLSQQLDNLLKFLQGLFAEYPSQKIQCCLAFLYAELLNDYLEATRLMIVQPLSEEKLAKLSGGFKLDLFSNKTAYIVVNLEDMTIIRHSGNAREFFKVDKLLLNNLIPNGVVQYHQEYIERFLQTGQSRYFRNISGNIAVGQSEFIQPINFFHEVIFDNQSLNTIVFVQQADDNDFQILVDNKFNICGITSELLIELNGRMGSPQFLYGLPIDLMIPKFTHLLSEVATQQINFHFLNSTSLQEFYQFMQLYPNNRRPSMDLIQGCWLDQSNLETYQTNCQIFNRESKYYIIKLFYLKRLTRHGSVSNTKTYTVRSQQEDEISMDEKIDLIYPYELSEVAQMENIQVIPISRPDFIYSNRESQNNTNLLNESDSRMIMMKPKIVDVPQQQFYIVEAANLSDSQQCVEQNIQVAVDDAGSLRSSISTARGSLYYKKFIIITKMVESKDYNNNELTLLSLLLLFILVMLTYTVIIYITTINQFNQYLTDIDLLQIKNYIFQPVEAFIVTRYTIINYNNQYAAKQLGNDEYKQLLEFPNSNLDLGFDDVRTNLAQILNRIPIQSFLQEYYDIYMYKASASDSGDLYNISMRQTLSILVNYQYTFKAAYLYDGRTVSDSPYIFFSYRNLLPVYNAFDYLNQLLYEETLNRVDKDIGDELSLFIPFALATLFIISLAFIVYLAIQRKYETILGLVSYGDENIIEQEMERYKYLADTINKNNDMIFRYNFSLEKKEQTLKIQHKKYQEGQQSRRYTYEPKGLQFISKLVLFMLFQSMFMSLCTYKYLMSKNYLENFKPTAYFYKQMADLGTNIPTLYAMREVLYYRWRYPFYTVEDANQILLQWQTCLNQTKSVTAFLASLQIDQYLLSNEFNDYINAIQEGSICEFQSEELKIKSKDICNITLEGSLTSGLNSALIHIYSSLQNEMQINLFLNKTERTYQEMEGGFIVSEVIKEINKFMKSDFTKITESIMTSLQIICIVYLVLCLGLILALYFYLGRKLQKVFYYVKRFIHLVPQQTLLFDDSFERVARAIMQQNSIL